MYTKRQEAEIITAIKGRGEVPLKYNYVSKKGAEAWNNIAIMRQDPKVRGINSIEGALLSNKASSFLAPYKDFKKINIIDIGCGNAYPVFPLMSRLNKNKVIVRYVPIDISETMIGMATKNVRKWFPKVEIVPHIIDYELGHFSDIVYDLRKNGYVNLLLFLGSTIGNASDRSRVLTNFRDSMTSEDYFIVGAELVNLAKVNKLIGHYTSKKIFNLVFSTLEYYGVKKTSVKYEIKFNYNLNQIEMLVKFIKNVKFKIGEEEIFLEKDDELLLGISVKFTDWSFAKLFSDVGFRIELFTSSPEKGYALTMCQPSRFRY